MQCLQKRNIKKLEKKIMLHIDFSWTSLSTRESAILQQKIVMHEVIHIIHKKRHYFNRTKVL